MNMSNQSGSFPPPAFNRGRAGNISLDTLRNEVQKHDRCISCLLKFNLSKKGKQRIERRILKLDSPLAFHIAAYSLARQDNNPWPGESSLRNRFHYFQDFAVCKTCFRFCQRKYPYSTFSNANSSKFAYLISHVTPAIQFGANLSLQIEEDIRNHDLEEAVAEHDIQEEVDILEIQHEPEMGSPHGNLDFARPPSPYIESDEEELHDQFFHFGMADRNEDPAYDSDENYEPYNQENIDPFSPRSADLTCPAQWSPHSQLNYDGFVQNLNNNTTSNYMICFPKFQESW